LRPRVNGHYSTSAGIESLLSIPSVQGLDFAGDPEIGLLSLCHREGGIMAQRSASKTTLLVAALTAIVLALPPVMAPPAAQGKTASKYLAPRLGIPKAKRYSKQALKHRFGNSYRHGYAKKLRCHRQWRTKVKCRVRWVIGDVSSKGTTTPFLYKRGHNWYWKVRYRIRVTNEYCLAVHHSRSRCSKVKKGVY
jgi:hypothetical protein